MRFLYFIVSVIGASVLALEILGTRLLAPFYGAGLFLWSSLISVTLLSLSLGYYIGGWWADRGATLRRLSLIIGSAGVWTVLIPWIKSPILTLLEPQGLRTSVLIGSTMLFLPPLTLLGMVSPYAIKLKATDLQRIGRTAGSLYAVSTAASVVGALLTGFYLIHEVGVNRLTIGIGILMLLTAGMGLWMESRRVLHPTVVLVLVLLAGGVAGLEMTSESASGAVLTEQSAYGELRVVDADAERHLLIDGGIHSLVDTSLWWSRLEYVAVMDIPRRFFSNPGRVLVMGLGAGSLAKYYWAAEWEVDAVEIDPKVVEVAQRFFGLQAKEATINIDDARKFLKTHPQTYDLILIDVFGSSSIPFHLVTREAFALAALRLREHGVLAMNVAARGWDDVIVRSLAATLKEHFRHVIALPIAEPPNTLGNLVLLARNEPFTMLQELERPYFLPDYRFSPQYQRVHAWDNQFEPDITGVPVLTDDRNPVDLWSEQINLVCRRDLHEYWRELGLRW